jgi:hypothetical protein
MIELRPAVRAGQSHLMVAGLNDFIWVPYAEPCTECGEPTCWLDLGFECRLCPGRCSERAWDQFWWADAMAHLNQVVDEFVEKERARLRRKRR